MYYPNSRHLMRSFQKVSGTVFGGNDLTPLIERLKELMLEGCIFRGISHQSGLLPKLIRNYPELAPKEFQILQTFEKYYGLYASANSPWEFLGLAQHYGLMTRLIDFTYNPYVALFFALARPLTEGGEYKIVVIKSEHFRKHDTAQEPLFSISPDGCLMCDDTLINRETPFSTVLENEFGRITPENGMLTVVDPNYRSARMLMQQGLFVVPAKIDKDSIMASMASCADFIKIDQTLRNDALQYLQKMGFDEFHLMPDIGSVCAEINSQVIGESQR